MIVVLGIITDVICSAALLTDRLTLHFWHFEFLDAPRLAVLATGRMKVKHKGRLAPPTVQQGPSAEVSLSLSHPAR